FAYGMGRQKVVETLVASGFDPNTQDKNGNTLLHMACYKKDLSLVELLLAKGADGNILNSLGLSPMYYAYYHNQPDIIELLRGNDEGKTEKKDDISNIKNKVGENDSDKQDIYKLYKLCKTIDSEYASLLDNYT